ncbi:probable mitogen-activated protein kinase kinase 2 at N-terminal half [Coccomyxa sp. Obi]|nr:probable mitogen-activated protein kinase kinase 2 at N-terminal half [Coccomyxa sp. Obi]
MHTAGVLHRDVKPSNLLVINGVVKLNDFDVSCRMEDEAARENLRIGTPEYQSPKLAQRYEERDDWLALALALLKLEGISIVDKHAALESACKGRSAERQREADEAEDQQDDGEMDADEAWQAAENAYHWDLVDLLRQPRMYLALGLPGVPHTIQHASLEERINSMKVCCRTDV